MCDCQPQTCKCQKAPDKPFDPSKPVETRNGNKARIIAADALGKAPIVALLRVSSDTVEMTYRFTAAGKLSGYNYGHPYDLVNIPERTEKFINIWKNRTPLHVSIESANSYNNFDQKQGILKLVYEDDKLISVEIVK